MSVARLARRVSLRRPCPDPQAASRDKGWPLDKTTLYTKATRFADASAVRTQRPGGGPLLDPTKECYVAYTQGHAALHACTHQAPGMLNMQWSQHAMEPRQAAAECFTQ
jgi:hypothetical protein